MTAERWCECVAVPEVLLKFVHLIMEGCGDVCVWSVMHMNKNNKKGNGYFMFTSSKRYLE